MASTNSNTCSCSSKVIATNPCDGCRKMFCRPCQMIHKRESEESYNELSANFQDLEHRLKGSSTRHEHLSEPWQNDIEKWRQEMHSKIDGFADKAIRESRQMFESELKPLCQKVEKINQDFRKSTKNRCYHDQYHKELKQNLEEMNKTCKNVSANIKIDTSATDRLSMNTFLQISYFRPRLPSAAVQTVDTRSSRQG